MYQRHQPAASPRHHQPGSTDMHTSRAGRIAGVFMLALALATSAGIFAVAPTARAVADTGTLNAIQIENEQPGDPTWDNFSANLNCSALGLWLPNQHR